MFPSHTAQVERLHAATDRLIAAIPAHAQARAVFERARDVHDDRRQAFILSGTPNQAPGARVAADVREAELARALTTETQVLRSARDGLRAAETELELAKVQERMERETLRAMNTPLRREEM